MNDTTPKWMALSAQQGDRPCGNTSGRLAVEHMRLAAILQMGAIHGRFGQPFGARPDQGTQQTRLHMIDMKTSTTVVTDAIQTQPERARIDDVLGDMQQRGDEVRKSPMLFRSIAKRMQEISERQIGHALRHAEALTAGWAVAKRFDGRQGIVRHGLVPDRQCGVSGLDGTQDFCAEAFASLVADERCDTA